MIRNLSKKMRRTESSMISGDECLEENAVADGLLCYRSRKPNAKAMSNAMRGISMKPDVVHVRGHKPA